MIYSRRSPLLWFIGGICVGILPNIYNVLVAEVPINENLVCVSGRRSYRSVKIPATRAVENGKAGRQTEGKSANHDVAIGNSSNNHGNSVKQRKILLDCGANIASTIMMFRETYPGGEDFEIHSFEIDDRLAPYFASYKGVTLHCPLGVSNVTGHMTSYAESPWSPDVGLNKGKDMHWGGGTLFVSDKEKQDEKTGGDRHLAYRKQIPVVDLSQWIQKNTSPDDYVLFKLDVEGAEFDILDRMLKDGTFKWIDKMYGEYHYSQPHGWDKKGRDRIKDAVKHQGFVEVDWAGEQRDYGDFQEMHPIHVTEDMPGTAGNVYTMCSGTKRVAIGVAVGMNYKRAHRLIETIKAYPVKIPVMLFFYGDFVQEYPDAVSRWSKHFDIGLREDSHYPLGHYEIMAYNWIRAALVGSEMKFRKIGIQPTFYLPLKLSYNVTLNAKNRGFRLVKPAAVFPPSLTYPEKAFNLKEYYDLRDVERIPKALRVIYQQINVNKGGILVLDSDLPDTFMNVIFLFDYFIRASDFTLVDMGGCVS